MLDQVYQNQVDTWLYEPSESVVRLYLTNSTTNFPLNETTNLFLSLSSLSTLTLIMVGPNSTTCSQSKLLSLHGGGLQTGPTANAKTGMERGAFIKPK